MTREEAVPGAVVVKLDKHGERKSGIYWIKEVLARSAVVTTRGEHEMSWVIRLSLLRLATAEERADAGL